MKKVVVILALSLFTLNNFAQNLQVHYDMGKDRGYATTTLEMFKPDQWGSTFYFVDFDYNTKQGNSVSFAYMEIARGLKFWDNPFEIHVEYNGGTFVNDAWLFGGNYTWNSPDFNRIFTLQAMYKKFRSNYDFSFQITGVWTMHFANKKLTFSGFADFWKEENSFDGETTDFVFLSEPQFWYNANEHLSLGSEIELASNFAGHKGFKVCPTLAVKWNF